MKRIAIVYGGDSVEHDISIVTAFLVMEECKKKHLPFLPIYISRKGELFTGKSLLKKENYENLKGFKNGYLIKKRKKNYFMQGFHHFEIQAAILCVHGFGAEDGTVGGFLDTLQIPVSYGGVENAAILQDKYLTKELLFKEGIPVVEGRKITKKEYFSDDFSLSSFLADFSFPLILKPVHLGSSIGVHKCENLEDVERFIIPLFHLEEEVMIEKVISHLKEFNIAILGDERKIWVSEIEEVNAQDEVLSFENKYEEFSGMTYRKIPANISSSLKEEIGKYAKKAFESLHCLGVVRFDFLYNAKSKKLYLNEINSIPGSLAYYLFESKGMSFYELITRLIDIAEYRKEKNKNRVHIYQGSHLTQIMHKK